MLLLDTCTLIWLVGDQSKLSERSRESLLIARRGALFVSAISGFEVALKHHKRQIRLPIPPQDWFRIALERYGLTALPLTWEIAVASTALPQLHKDPSDRMIVATAQAHSLRLVTPDPLIAQYPGIEIFW